MLNNKQDHLFDWFLIFWQRKLIIFVITFFACIYSVFEALSIPNTYRSEILLASVQPTESRSSLLSQYSGLASLAGVNLSGVSSVSKERMAIELLKSRGFLGDFFEKHSIVPDLMYAAYWDSQSKTIVYDDTIYDSKNRVLINPLAKPKFYEVFDAFRGALAVNQDPETGLVKVSLDHLSPEKAQEWLTWLVDDLNETMRLRDINQAKRSIEYLKKQEEKNSLAELDQIFFQLIQSQVQTIMLAEAKPEYIFTIVDPATLPELKVGPRRALIVIVGTLMGVMAGALFSLLMFFKPHLKINATSKNSADS